MEKCGKWDGSLFEKLCKGKQEYFLFEYICLI